MKRRVVAGASLAIAMVLFLPVFTADPASGADGKAGLDGKGLFENKCGVCHGLSLSTGRREWRPEWRGIVDRMARKRDGWISPEEAVAIVEYLSAEFGRN